MASGEVHEVAAGGLTFAYRAAGQPDKPPMVLLHGMGEGAESWEPVLADLAGLRYRAIALDARGLGSQNSANAG